MVGVQLRANEWWKIILRGSFILFQAFMIISFLIPSGPGGYHSSIVDDAFNKFSDIANRKNLYAPKNKDETTNTHGDGSESTTSQHAEHYSQV